MLAIKTDRLTKSYGKQRGIENLSIEISEGDFFGFIGPNGAGKSTTIRTLLGFITKNSGDAEIFGMDITEKREHILALTGYLPSEVAYYSGMRVRDMLSLSASLRGIDCSAEANALCERLKLDPTQKISSLSFGNRKKVGIIAALQHKPRLCILDEATSGLDPLMQYEFFEILKERNRDGATIFLSSHNLAEIGKHCRSAAVIREGKILVSDSIENLSCTGVKRVTLRGASQMPSVNDARNITTDGDTLSFLYGGATDGLIKALSSISFYDITITDPDAEEVFLNYYTGEAR